MREVRIREVPEMEFCLVYVPRSAELYRLNPAAWFVMRMCEGRTRAQIARAYHEAMEPVLSREEAQREVRGGIESLMKLRIIQRIPGKARNHQPKKRRVRHAHEK